MSLKRCNFSYYCMRDVCTSFVRLKSSLKVWKQTSTVLWGFFLEKLCTLSYFIQLLLQCVAMRYFFVFSASFRRSSFIRSLPYKKKNNQIKSCCTWYDILSGARRLDLSIYFRRKQKNRCMIAPIFCLLLWLFVLSFFSTDCALYIHPCFALARSISCLSPPPLSLSPFLPFFRPFPRHNFTLPKKIPLHSQNAFRLCVNI